MVDWRPLFRDSVAFFITIVVTYFVMATGSEVLWYEALMMMLLYAGYIFMMVFNDRLMVALDNSGKQSPIVSSQHTNSNSFALFLSPQPILQRSSSPVERKSPQRTLRPHLVQWPRSHLGGRMRPHNNRSARFPSLRTRGWPVSPLLRQQLLQVLPT